MKNGIIIETSFYKNFTNLKLTTKMEKNLSKMEQKQDADVQEKKITRKQAIKKAGLIAASTATMMVMLNNNSQAMVVPKDGFKPGGGGKHCWPKGSPGR
jgi:hypothetical protein